MSLTTIPFDLTVCIFDYLSVPDLLSLRQVSKTCRSFCAHNRVWYNPLHRLVQYDITDFVHRMNYPLADVYRACYELRPIRARSTETLLMYIASILELNQEIKRCIEEDDGDLEAIDSPDLCDDSGAIDLSFMNILPPYLIYETTRDYLLPQICVTIAPAVQPGQWHEGHWVDGRIVGIDILVRYFDNSTEQFSTLIEFQAWLDNILSEGYFLILPIKDEAIAQWIDNHLSLCFEC